MCAYKIFAKFLNAVLFLRKSVPHFSFIFLPFLVHLTDTLNEIPCIRTSLFCPKSNCGKSGRYLGNWVGELKSDAGSSWVSRGAGSECGQCAWLMAAAASAARQSVAAHHRHRIAMRLVASLAVQGPLPSPLQPLIIFAAAFLLAGIHAEPQQNVRKIHYLYSWLTS